MSGGAGLERLAEKYRALLALRARRERLEAAGHRAFPPDEAARRRRSFRALARRFPSCLSELELPVAELRRREAIVRRGIGASLSAEEAAWAASMVELHLALRLLLAARRWIRRGGSEQAFVRWCRRFEARARARGLEGRGAATWARRLGLPPGELFAWIRQPPDGRWRPHLERALRLAPGAPRPTAP